MNSPLSTNPSEYTFTTTPFADLVVASRGIYHDERGVFEKPYISNEFSDKFSFTSLREVNVSRTSKSGTIRGFHQQLEPKSETKIITCISGSILDCVIDLRVKSKTFGGIFTIKIEAHSGVSLIIPKGFAHAFQSLEDSSALIYSVDNSYDSSLQTGVNPLSPELMHIWPLEVTNISEQDKNLPFWMERVDRLPWRP